MPGMGLRGQIREALARTSHRTLAIEGFRKAAVLVPLIERDDVVTLLFTLRSKDLTMHPGQISFPGGRPHLGEDGATTALREAKEELAIEPRQVTVLGMLDDVATPSGFLITPVVGWLVDPVAFQADAQEVAEFFEVPLREIADPGCHAHRGERVIAGTTYALPEYTVGERVIWGATARMVQMLLERMGGEPAV